MFVAGLLCVLVAMPFRFTEDASLDKKVSVELEAAPAERLLPELGKAYGVRLRAEGPTRGDVLVISVKDVSLKDLMARIARLDSAEWQKAPDGGFELIRTADHKRDQERKDLVNETELIRKMQEDYGKRLPPFAGLTVSEAESILKRLKQMYAEVQPRYTAPTQKDVDDQAARDAVANQLPLKRLLQRIVLGLDPSFLASLPVGVEIAFSDTPNKAQRQLPMSLSKVYRQFLNEHRLFFEATGSQVSTTTSSAPAEIIIGNVIYRDAPLKALLKINKTGSGTLYFNLYLFSKDGRYDSTSDFIYHKGAQVLVEKRESAGLLESVPPSTAQFLTECKRLIPVEDGAVLDVDPTVKSWYLNPVEKDPLALTTGGMLLAIAHERKGNLIAVLNHDIRSVLSSIAYFPNRTVLDTEKLLGYRDYHFEYPKDWMEASPRFPSHTWRNQIDRRTLKSLFGATSLTLPGLNVTAHFALELPQSFENGVAYLMTVFSEGGWRMFQDLQWKYEQLRFYGTLTISQKKALLDGKSIRVGDLRREQIQALNQAIYSRGTQLMAVVPPDPEGWVSPIGISFGEPTEILSNGLSPDATFTMKATESMMVLPYTGKKPRTRPLSAMELAFELARAQPTVPAQMRAVLPTGYRLRWQRNLDFSFALSPDISGSMSFIDSEQDRSERLLKYSELPHSFLDEVENHINGMGTTSYGGFGGGQINP